MSVANRVTKLFNSDKKVHTSIEYTCLRILKLCNSKSLQHGLCVHTPILKLGLYQNLYLTNNVLTLYGKCHGPETARHFFDEMPHRDVVSWTGLVSAYTRRDRHVEAIELFDSMVVWGGIPNEFTLSCVLRSCSSLGEFGVGIRVHAYVVKFGFETNAVLVSSLTDFYAKCGLFKNSRKIFEEMDGSGDTVTWTTMISSLVQARKWRLALRNYVEMIRTRVPPNKFTFVKLIEASSRLDLNHGKLLHAHLVIWGVRVSSVLKTALVEMYSRFRRMEEAVKVVNLTPRHDVFLWTCLISGFIDNLRVKDAVSALTRMESFGVFPNRFTYSSVLKACSTISSLELGKQIHSIVIVSGLESDVCVGNSLIEMYLTCSNFVDDSFRAFKEINSPNSVSWNSLISGFFKHDFKRELFKTFSQMRAQGMLPNSDSISSILSICRSRALISKLHGHIIKFKPDSDIVVGNALVDAYASTGMVSDSWRVLTTMSHKDVTSYTSFATRMNKSGRPGVAIGVIKSMTDNGIKMDGFSLASFLSAAAELAALETGKQLHCRVVKSGFGSSTSVSNVLVDLYWKCGQSNEGQQAFREISKPDVVSWNGLISGLASNGNIHKALSVFDDMRLAGFKPDSVTFLSLLFGCSRGGLVDLGIEYFHSMKRDHNIVPQLDHYVCLVDLLGRAGQLENAMDMIASMPFKPNSLIYKTLLTSCRLHGNVLLGEDLTRRGTKLDPFDPAFYTILANLYDDCGHTDLAKKTRRLLRDKGLRRNIGRSWMEVRNKLHVFESGDESHPQISEINEKIESLVTKLKKQGYNCSASEGSAHHSEKLAIAFGLLNRPANDVILVSKNIRICSECHDFIMLVTQLVNRVIIVKDGNRIHNFKNGKCSCQTC